MSPPPGSLLLARLPAEASMKPVSRLPGRVPEGSVFVLFSNNLGCLGSILVSVVGTLVLLLLLGVID
jgi:hypothetical protein